MYTFKNTERNNKKSSEFETKSLLYLIGMRPDRKEIELVTIDCFNDVTGSNIDCSKLWDIQSKNHAILNPAKIGESLYTLYDNFISKINFVDYILFIPKLKPEYLINNSLNTYKYANIKKKIQTGIEKKLKVKIGDTSPPLFDNFLENVIFVQDNKRISTYIKTIAHFKNKKIVTEAFYESIFNEIRDIQTGLKNSYIENITIKNPKEVLNFNRHITKNDINTLLISRLLGVEIFSSHGIPAAFLPFIKDIFDDEEAVKDLIQECNANLSRAFFNKNDSRKFWKISELIISEIRGNRGYDVNQIYAFLELSMNITSIYLTRETIQYMIALIKTGIENDN